MAATSSHELLDPFQAALGQKSAADLGPALLQPEKDEDRAQCGCEGAAALKVRLNAVTNGLVDKLANVPGLLFAGGCVVDALTGGAHLVLHTSCT